MPQASVFAFARSRDLDPDGDGLRHAMRPVNGNRTPLPSSQPMPSSLASMVLAVAFPVVTKSPVHPRGEVQCPVCREQRAGCAPRVRNNIRSDDGSSLRTSLLAPVESVTYRFQIADAVRNASVAAGPCSILPDDGAEGLSTLSFLFARMWLGTAVLSDCHRSPSSR